MLGEFLVALPRVFSRFHTPDLLYNLESGRRGQTAKEKTFGFPLIALNVTGGLFAVVSKAAFRNPMMKRTFYRRVAFTCIALGFGNIELLAERMSYKEYLQKHPTPKPAPKVGKDGIEQGPKTNAQSTDDAATTNKKKELRRVALGKEIARQQAIMDAYEKQNSAAKKTSGITEDQYLQAKSARDRAQAERDELAR